MNPTERALTEAGNPAATLPDLCILTGQTPAAVLRDIQALDTAGRLLAFAPEQGGTLYAFAVLRATVGA